MTAIVEATKRGESICINKVDKKWYEQINNKMTMKYNHEFTS